MNRFDRAGLVLASLLLITACGNEPADSTAQRSSAQTAPAQPSIAPSPVESPADALPAVASMSSASSPEDVAAIRAAGVSRDEAYRAGNANGIVAVFENDAVLMPPAAPTAMGRLAIRKFLAGDLSEMAASGFATQIPADSVEISVSGDFAFRSGTYSTSDKSAVIVDTGKWLEVWHKSNGQWRISRSISNSDSLPLLPNMPEDGNGAE